MPRKNKKFEDFLPLIDQELAKREYLYKLKAVPHLDWDDFSQECRLRIFNKFHLYKQGRPFLPWVNSVIHNFLTNWWRDKYFRFSRPCVKCPLAVSNSSECLYTKSGKQDSECCFMKGWLRSAKKDAFDVNMSLSMENHLSEVYEKPHEEINYDKSKKNLDRELKRVLTKFHWKVYKLLFIKELPERDVVKLLGFKREVGRDDVKQTRDAVAVIKLAARKILSEDKVDIL